MFFSKYCSIVFAYCLLLVGFQLEAKTPVHYGGDENVDACSSFAQVKNLGKGSDAFLAVKDEPNLKAKRIDKIFSNQKLWICEESKDGKWFGVVYTTTENQGCGVTTVVKNRKPYLTPCKSGWVSQKYVTLIAG